MTALRYSTRDAVERWFHENFTLRGELGASVSVWGDGEEIINLGHGHANRERTRPWTPDECRVYLHLDTCPPAP